MSGFLPSSCGAIWWVGQGLGVDSRTPPPSPQEAEKMVAALQESTVEEERFTQAMVEPRNTAAALPLCHDAARKWFYKDPQGEIQGELHSAHSGTPELGASILVLTPRSHPRRPLHDARDGRVVPGWVLQHVTAGEEGL